MLRAKGPLGQTQENDEMATVSERQRDWHERHDIARADYIRRNAVRLNREFWERKAKECKQ